MNEQGEEDVPHLSWLVICSLQCCPYVPTMVHTSDNLRVFDVTCHGEHTTLHRAAMDHSNCCMHHNKCLESPRRDRDCMCAILAV